MSRDALVPTSHVGKAVRQSKPQPGLPSHRLPGARYHIATGNETLYGLAQELYGNPREAIRIYNANRAGVIRDDRAMGFINNMNDALPVGALILIP